MILGVLLILFGMFVFRFFFFIFRYTWKAVFWIFLGIPLALFFIFGGMIAIGLLFLVPCSLLLAAK